MTPPHRNKPRRVISEELFKRMLARERKRADRSNLPVVLILVDILTPLTADSSSIWDQAIEALAAATRETDILGWIEWRSVIGIILSEVRPAKAAEAREQLDARFRRELARRVEARTLDRLSIRLSIQSEPGTAEEETPWPADPKLFAERRPQTGRVIYEAIKRGLDIAGSLTLLLILSPVFLAIAALVKSTSRGPVFFGQTRIGRMMKPFKMFKFRTMNSNADSALHREFVSAFIQAGPPPDSDTRRVFKLVDDPRVTAIGRILRKTSLDELPQLWNVFRGDMSLVGPRPPLPYELEQYKPWHCRRVLEAKPGMTGLWQISGRSRTTFDEMVRLDLRYARIRSLSTDLRILLATPGAVVSGKGAR